MFAIVLLCLVGALSLPGADDTFGTCLTYVGGRGYAVVVFRDRTVLRTSKPLMVPPLGPWVAGAVDVDVWLRSRRQTWSQRRFLGFYVFSGELVTTGLAQHPFLPDRGVTRIRYYDMEHAVAVPHWAALLGTLVLTGLWWSRRRRAAGRARFEPRVADLAVTAAASPSAPAPRSRS